ncbi:MAG TPA: metallophosphoesterase [Myxococcales bacterium]|nr:metallophosphoesterase [Myxococcales bacterium]
MKLVHFSDVHVQLRDWRHRRLRELGPLRALATVELWKGRGREYDRAEETLRALAGAARAADHAVCTGDLTQLGHPEEFAAARAALGPLAADAGRFTTFPGNHDRYPWQGAPSRLFEDHFPEQSRTDLPGPLRVRILGEAALVVVDSAGPLCWPIVSLGRIGREQLDALEAALLAPELRGLCKLVAVHHTPRLRGGRRDRPWHALRGADDLLASAQRGGAQAILCGHIHDRFVHGEAPAVICAGSSTRLGAEGYFELQVRSGRVASVTERALTS